MDYEIKRSKSKEMKYLLVYWVISTIYTVLFRISNPCGLEDKDEVSMFEILGHLFPAALLGWFIMPMCILDNIKFKRPRQP